MPRTPPHLTRFGSDIWISPSDHEDFDALDGLIQRLGGRRTDVRRSARRRSVLGAPSAIPAGVVYTFHALGSPAETIRTITLMVTRPAEIDALVATDDTSVFNPKASPRRKRPGASSPRGGRAPHTGRERMGKFGAA